MKTRRKKELKLLHAAGVGNLRKVIKLLPNESSSSDSDSSRKRSKRKRRRKSWDAGDRPNVNCVDSDGWTPLHLASHAGATDVVGHLLSQGGDVSAVDGRGDTPLHLAARSGAAKVIAELREAGGKMSVRNKRGETPAMLVEERLIKLARREEARARGSRYEEPEDWGERLQEEASDGEGGGTWGASASHREGEVEDVVDEDAWRARIAESMARKRHEAGWQQDELRAKLSAEQAKEEDARERKRRRLDEEAAARSRKILEEEQAKDSAWREEVLAGKFLNKKMRYEEAWTRFASSSNMVVSYLDVPFPVDPGQEGQLERVLLHGVAPEKHKKKLREEVLRWHPDKFTQKWGLRLDEKDKDRTINRVKEISQSIHELYSKL